MVLFVDIDKLQKKSNHYCAVEKCYNSIDYQNVKFYKFPNNFKLCEKWISKCNRSDLINISFDVIAENFHICHEHFDHDAYLIDDILKSTAIPTLHLNSSESSSPSSLCSSYNNYSPLTKFYENFLLYEEYSSDKYEYYNDGKNSNQIVFDHFPDVSDEILDIIIQSIVDMQFLSAEDVEITLQFYENELNYNNKFWSMTNFNNINNNGTNYDASLDNQANNYFYLSNDYLNDITINKDKKFRNKLKRQLESYPTNFDMGKIFKIFIYFLAINLMNFVFFFLVFVRKIFEW